MPSERVEQRGRLRAERPADDTAVVVRGRSDTVGRLRRHAERTARAWSLDGQPLLGVSVFAVPSIDLDKLLRKRLATFRPIRASPVGALRSAGFELLATDLPPHFTVRLRSGDDDVELRALIAVLGKARDNPHYGTSLIWRRES